MGESVSVTVVDRELNVKDLMGAYVRTLSIVLAGSDKMRVLAPFHENGPP